MTLEVDVTTNKIQKNYMVVSQVQTVTFIEYPV